MIIKDIMEVKKEQKKVDEAAVQAESQEKEIERQYEQIISVFRENKEKNIVVKLLFTLIPELESIQKEVRQRVLLVDHSGFRFAIKLFIRSLMQERS